MRVGKAFLYLLYAAAVIVLGTLISLSATKSGPPVSAKQQVSSRTAGAAIGQVGSATGKTKVAAPTASSAASSSSTTVAASNGTTLADTGPGNLLIVFLITCLVGTVAYSRFIAGRVNS